MGITLITASLLTIGAGIQPQGGAEVPPGLTPYSSYTPMIYSMPSLIKTPSGNTFTVTASITDQDTAGASGQGSQQYGCYHTEWVWGSITSPETGLGAPNAQNKANGEHEFTWTSVRHGFTGTIDVYTVTPHDFGGGSAAHNNSSISDGYGNSQELKIEITGSGTTPGGGTGGGTGPVGGGR